MCHESLTRSLPGDLFVRGFEFSRCSSTYLSGWQLYVKISVSNVIV